MSDGPYRDIGSGFVRLSGLEAPRRAPSSITRVEDVLDALLDNSRNAGAKRIFVATSLSARRYRTLHVLDDGEGVPETHTEAIFEPGVTSRPLAPASTGLPASGLSLYHVKTLAHEAGLASHASPTAIRVTLDTRKIPERTLQSTARTSKTNLLATARAFARKNPDITLTLGTPSEILASLIKNNIIHQNETVTEISTHGRGYDGGHAEDITHIEDVADDSGSVAGDSGVFSGSSRREIAGVFGEALGLGFRVSKRTLTRVLRGEVRPGGVVLGGDPGSGEGVSSVRGESGRGGVVLRLGGRDRERISDIIGGAARAEYLALGSIRFESSGGSINIKAEILEPEGEYDDRDL